MKQIKFLAMAFAALAVFSCTKDDANKATDPATPGQPVYAQFSISLPDAASRGTATDASGTDLENTISDLKVYLIGSNRLVEAVLDAKTVTGTNDYATQITQITTGEKQVIAVVNAGTTRTSAIFSKGDNLSKIEDALIANVAAAVDDKTVLFSSRLVTVNMVDKSGLNGVDNAPTSQTEPFKFEVSVDRSVAKVIVRDDITVNANVGGVGVGGDNTYTAGSARFAINGMLTNAGLYQCVTAGLPANHKSAVHNWWQNGTNAISAPAQTPAALKAVAMSAYGPLAAAYNDKASDMANITGDGTNGGRYTLENVVSNQGKYGESTIIYAHLKIVPKAKFTDGTTGAVGADIKVDDDYYAVKHISANEYMFFASKADFDTWKSVGNPGDNNTDYVDGNGTLYVDGVNYYRVNITNENGKTPELKYSLLRNKIYDVTLKEVKNFGKGTDEDLVKPTDPIETNAWIEATVKVKTWTVDRQESNLE
ncbi:MAG: Mfa1 family fimbria major subunit [Mucinivorans sp.]